MEIKEKIKSNRHKQVIIVIIALVFIICILYQFSKDVNIYKKNVNIQSLERVTMQSANIIENELQQYLDFITQLSKNLEKKDIYSQDVMDTIKYLCDFSNFQRMGIANTNGHAHVTNGDEVSIKGREFFEKAIQGEYFISDALESRILNEQIIVISAPIYNNDQIKGVLYGIMELRHIPLLKNNAMETNYHWLDIIDADGNFIRKSTAVYEMYGDSSCAFDILKDMDMTIDVEELKTKFYNREEIIFEAMNNGKRSYIYFEPLKINQWYLVSVIDQDFYETTVGLGFDAAIMNTIGLIIVVFLVTGAIVAYLYYREQKYIKNLNNYLAFIEKVYRITSTKTENIVFVYDVENDDLQFINSHFESLDQGESLKRMFKETINQLIHCKDIQDQLLKLVDTYEDYEVQIPLEYNQVTEYYAISMSYLSDTMATHNRCVGTIRNITEEKKKEEQLKMKAQIDSLTKLYNREAGEEKIKSMLHGDQTHALVLIDLDDFKQINDTLGHDYGDRVLRDIGRELRHHFRKEDIIFRLGGDEFVVFIHNISEDVVLKVVNALLSKVQMVYSDNMHEIKTHVSAGVAMYPYMGTTFETLYKKADKALYASKNSGKNQCCMWKDA